MQAAGFVWYAARGGMHVDTVQGEEAALSSPIWALWQEVQLTQQWVPAAAP